MLAQEAPLSGRAAEGIRHALEALACLERTGRAWWIGQAHWVVGLNHAQLGELDAALEAETRARIIGETVGDRQLQASALSAIGIVHAVLGDAEAGIEACERGLAVAPDPLTRAVALGWLGFAFVEQGDAPRAIPALETAVQQHGVFRFPQFQGWFTAFLADAYRLDGRRDQALATAREALEITRAARLALRCRAGPPGSRARPARDRRPVRGHGDAPRSRGDVRGDPGALRRGARVDG